MSWWANKISQPGPPMAPANPNLPAGLGRNRQQAVDRYVAQYAPAASGPVINPVTGEAVPEGSVLASDAIRRWQGNPQGGASEMQLCPKCGSHLFSSQRTGAVTSQAVGGMVAPRPSCFSCGYPQEQGSLAVLPSAVEGVKSARQGEAMPWSPSPTPVSGAS